MHAVLLLSVFVISFWRSIYGEIFYGSKPTRSFLHREIKIPRKVYNQGMNKKIKQTKEKFSVIFMYPILIQLSIAFEENRKFLLN